MKKQSILGAICKATFAWLFLYVTASQVMVAVQWDMIEHTVYNQVVEEVEVLVPSEDVIEEIIVEDDTIALDDVTKARSQELLQRLQEAQSVLTTGMESLESSVDLLIHNSKKEMEYPAALAVSDESSFPALESLLKLKTLRTTNDEELSEMLTKALEQIEEASSSRIMSKTWMDFLQAGEFERELPGEVPIDCPQVERPEGARQSDLKALLSKIRHATDEERQGRLIDEILDDAGATVVAEEVDRYEPIELPPPIYEVEPVVETVKDDRICLLEEDLRDMIVVAKTSQDLRRALTEIVKTLEPEADLILDAPLLPASKDTSSPHDQSPTTLRQALNSEWLWHTSTSTVDAVVDLASGYHDGIDGALDSLLAQHGGTEESSVGRIFVSRFLELVGNVGLPDQVVKLYNETKAGMLRA